MHDYFAAPGTTRDPDTRDPFAPPPPLPATPAPAAPSGRTLLVLVRLVVALLAVTLGAVVFVRASRPSLPEELLGFPRLTSAAVKAEEAHFERMPTPGKRVAATYGVGDEPHIVVGLGRHDMGRDDPAQFFASAERTYVAAAAGIRFDDVFVPRWLGRLRCADLYVPDRGEALLCLFAEKRGYGVITTYGEDAVDQARRVLPVLTGRL